MSLDNINVENEGAISRAKCDNLPDLMVIAGPNGVGKSTLIENIHEGVVDGAAQSFNVGDPTDCVYFSPHRTPAPADISELYLAGSSDERYIDALSGTNYNPGGSQNPPRNIRHMSGNRDRQRPDAAPYFAVKERLAKLKSQKGSLLDEVYNRQNRVPEGYMPDIYGPFEEAIEAVLPGISFNGVELDDSNNYEITFKNRTGDLVQFDELSSGEKDVTALLFLLTEDKIEQKVAEVREIEYSPNDLLLLIDGPESYLHPQLQLNFLEYCRDFIDGAEDRTIQIILATHSQMILENADKMELFLLLYPDQTDGNQLKKANELDIDLFRSITGELGTAALSTGNPILLVEGKSDREILRRLFPELDNNLTIIPLGGKNPTVNLDDALEELEPELAPIGIEIHAIVDRDQDHNLSQETSDRIRVLPGTCMENMLLIDRPLFDSITTLANDEDLDNEGVNSPSDINRLLREIINEDEFRKRELISRINDNLMFRAFVRDEDEITLEAVKNKMDEVNEQKKEKLEDRFSDIEENVDRYISSGEYDELDGKRIISELSNKVNVGKDSLIKVTAEKINDGNAHREDLRDMINQIQ